MKRILMLALLLTACADAVQEADQQANQTPVEAPAPEPTAPKRPGNIIATPGDQEIILSWGTVGNATSYNLFWMANRGGISINDNPIIDIKSPYTHTGLTNDTTYYYGAQAVNSIGKSGLSTEVSVAPSPLMVLYVDSAANDDSGDGLTTGTAKLTIKAAIDAATAPARIQVKGGIYNVDSSSVNRRLKLVKGVSLYGGYNADFTVRDSAVYVTTINDTNSKPDSSAHLIWVPRGISAATTIDGFVLNASIQAGPRNSNAIFIDGSGVTIQNNSINGGAGSKGSHGVYVLWGSNTSMIQNNTINGGRGLVSSIGLHLRGGPATIQNNIIEGGTGETTAALRSVDAGGLRIVRNNIIDPQGGDLTTNAYGITNRSLMKIENNIIFGAKSYERNVCISNSSYSSTDIPPLLAVRNNVFFDCQIVHVDYYVGLNSPSPSRCPDTECTLSEMEAVLGATGNIDVNPYLSQTPGDWHFTDATPPAVTRGGLNGIDEAWGFATDKDGVTRPESGSPWAIGAYEPNP